MSEIATLEKLELHLAQVINPTLATPAANPAPTPPQSMTSGRSGSHLELFFSEVQYSTFVAKKPRAKMAEKSTNNSNSGSGALKYSLRLH